MLTPEDLAGHDGEFTAEIRGHEITLYWRGSTYLEDLDIEDDTFEFEAAKRDFQRRRKAALEPQEPHFDALREMDLLEKGDDGIEQVDTEAIKALEPGTPKRKEARQHVKAINRIASEASDIRLGVRSEHLDPITHFVDEHIVGAEGLADSEGHTKWTEMDVGFRHRILEELGNQCWVDLYDSIKTHKALSPEAKKKSDDTSS